MIIKIKTKEQVITDGAFIDKDGDLWYSEAEFERSKKPKARNNSSYYAVIEIREDILGNIITNEKALETTSMKYVASSCDDLFKKIYSWAGTIMTKEKNPEYFL